MPRNRCITGVVQPILWPESAPQPAAARRRCSAFCTAYAALMCPGRQSSGRPAKRCRARRDCASNSAARSIAEGVIEISRRAAIIDLNGAMASARGVKACRRSWQFHGQVSGSQVMQGESQTAPVVFVMLV